MTISGDSSLAPFYHTSAGGDTSVQAPMVAGTLTNFRVVINVAPGATGNQSWTAHINRNGTSQASCTMGSGQTSCTIAGPVTFNNADRLSIRMLRTGSAPAVRVAFKAEYAFAP